MKEIRVNPQHNRLEKAFAAFLSTVGALEIKGNVEAIDIRFNFPGHGNIIAELKPAEPGQTKYPIRFAVGQILEYRHFKCPDTHPMIVLGAEPRDSEIAFCHSLGISVAWKSADSFELRWQG
ncbi:hypothetical protein AJ88_15700 [Mesorhizobium amorphae CCBAU 01583]|nr:hypothetical protein AJ88_15700 [Mesorhizobium amorphae CCBAU 01583]